MKTIKELEAEKNSYKAPIHSIDWTLASLEEHINILKDIVRLIKQKFAVLIYKKSWTEKECRIIDQIEEEIKKEIEG